jgi:trans-feruloyl-CoA hydratase/vanillin synthase
MKTVKVTLEDGIAWVAMNRPDKKNAISIQMAHDMVAALDSLETDRRCEVVVITGAGESFSAGMDLKDYFRASDKGTPVERARVYRLNAAWQWRGLLDYPKPTIAMVNGWCFGGAFTPVVACDLAVADEKAQFGLSEINWGIIPAGVVCKAVSTVMSQRDAMYYIMTGETFDGRRAAQMGLVNEAVPTKKLRAKVKEIAGTLKKKNPAVLRQAKTAFRHASRMSWDDAADYLFAKSDQVIATDPERGREEGLRQFLDEKSFRPGLEPYKRRSK